MKKSLKRQWVADLRSGKYAQGHRTLAVELGPITEGGPDRIGYCCIGVLVQGAARETIEAEGYTVTNDLTQLNLSGKLGIRWPGGMGLSRHDLPLQLLPAVGLTRKQQDKLVQMNDQEGKSFAEIADWVVKNIPSEDDNA